MKRLLSEILFAVALSASLAPAPAQAPAALRAELPVAEGDAAYTLIPLARLGVLAVMRQNDLFSGRDERLLVFFDENLDKRWEAALPMPSIYNYVGYELGEDSLRLLLSPLPEKSSPPVFLEIPVCLADGNFRLQYRPAGGNIPHKATIGEGHHCDSLWHIPARTGNRYFYLRLHTRTDSLSVFELASSKDHILCHAAWDDSLQKAFFLFRDAQSDDKSLYLKIIPYTGDEIQERVVGAPREEIRLIDAQIALLGNDNYLVAGTWNNAAAKQHTAAYDRGTETEGIFIARYENGIQQSFNTLPYLEFPQVDTLLSDEERQKLQLARRKAGHRQILPDYLANLRFFERAGQFHLLAETYERLLSTVTEVSYDFYGRMIPYTSTRFDGYRYKNTFYAAWDSNGMEQHNSVFNIAHSRQGQYLEPIAAIAQDSAGERILYAYTDNGIVFYRSMNKEGGISPIQSFRLSCAVPGDRVQKTWNEGLEFWYPGCLLSYGYQQILNSRRKGKSRQNVFYINKIKIVD